MISSTQRVRYVKGQMFTGLLLKSMSGGFLLDVYHMLLGRPHEDILCEESQDNPITLGAWQN